MTDEGYVELAADMTPRISHEQRGFARKLRREMSTAEAMLWRSLRGRAIGGKFRRQLPVGIYVADFACVEARLIVECDGPSHDTLERRTKDEERNAWFNRQGWRVLRFSNDLVLTAGDLVVEQIRNALA